MQHSKSADSDKMMKKFNISDLLPSIEIVLQWNERNFSSKFANIR